MNESDKIQNLIIKGQETYKKRNGLMGSNDESESVSSSPSSSSFKDINPWVLGWLVALTLLSVINLCV